MKFISLLILYFTANDIVHTDYLIVKKHKKGTSLRMKKGTSLRMKKGTSLRMKKINLSNMIFLTLEQITLQRLQIYIYCRIFTFCVRIHGKAPPLFIIYTLLKSTIIYSSNYSENHPYSQNLYTF